MNLWAEQIGFSAKNHQTIKQTKKSKKTQNWEAVEAGDGSGRSWEELSLRAYSLALRQWFLKISTHSENALDCMGCLYE